MTKKYVNKILFILVIVLILGGIFYYSSPPPPGAINTEDNLIRITSPKPNDLVRSPLVIEGEARGNWYFEASFPVRLIDGNGKELAIIPAQAEGEWMTTEFVPFKATLTFLPPTTEQGILILQKDNPSGLPEHDDERRIPVRFDTSGIPQRTVKLYFYNADKDKDMSGNIMCSAKGLEAIERHTPITITPIQDTIRLLLKGELTAGERERGITTEYPLPGVLLTSASQNNGVLTLTFADPENKTSGGACRASILWLQIEATAKQFPGITQVRFLPETLFQP